MSDTNDLDDVESIIEDYDEKKWRSINVLALNRRKRECMEPWVVDDESQVFVSSDLCLHPDTEYLTPEGWLNVADLKEGMQVWQVDKDTLQGSFVTPSRIIAKEYDGDMINYDEASVRGGVCVTRGHTMLHIGQLRHKRADKAKWRGVFLAGDNPPSKAGAFANFSYSNEGEDNEIYPDSDIWRACALQADSHYDVSKTYRFDVRKPRKVAKLQELFGEGRYIVRKDNGKTSFLLRVSKFTHPLVSGKDINIEKLHPSQIPVFLEALEFWDGCPTARTPLGRITWGSTNKKLCERIQAYLVKHGYECRSTVSQPPGDNSKLFYHLSIKLEGSTRQSGKDEVFGKVTPYTGKVYCVTVPTGFIMVRYKGQCTVVGNCSAEPTLMLNFSNDPMLKFFLYDARGQPPRWQGDILLTDSMYITYASTTTLGKEVLAPLLKATDWVEGETLTFAEAYMRDSDLIKKRMDKMGNYYRIFKQLTLALFYGLGARGIVEQMAIAGKYIELEEAYAMHKAFWNLFKDLNRFQRALQKLYSERRFITNPLGFKLNTEQHKVLNAYVQSTVSSIVSQLLYALDQVPWLTYIVTIHDEIIFSMAEDKVDKFVILRDSALEGLNEALAFQYPIKMGKAIGRDFYSAH